MKSATVVAVLSARAYCTSKALNIQQEEIQNSNVFEQKGNLLNFMANIDPMPVLSQAEPSWAKLGQDGPSTNLLHTY